MRAGGATDAAGVAGLLSVEAARAAVLAAIPGPLPAERLGTADALGRVLAEPAIATTDLPPWDNSAMDGYAVRAADVATASEETPVTLRVVGEARAGVAPAVQVMPGTAVRIATGAPVPQGADAVVPVELTTALGADEAPSGRRGRDASGPLPAACLVHEPVTLGGSIRPRGEDVRTGTAVLAAGVPVTAAAIAVAAGAGVSALLVHRRPRVAVLATGDEVRPAGESLGPAGIPDSNGPALRALVASAGGVPIDLGIARDDLDDVLGRLRRGVAEADAIVVSGGVSVGPYDVVKLAFERLGRVDLWRVAVQPGKPFAFGTASGGSMDRPPVLLFGLPGNPVSSAVTFELFVRPAIRRLAGRRDLLRPLDRGVLLDAATTSAGRRAFLRVTVDRDARGTPARDGEGRICVHLAGGQGSHVLSALAAADALAVVPEEIAAIEPGTEVDIWWLDRE